MKERNCLACTQRGQHIFCGLNAGALQGLQSLGRSIRLDEGHVLLREGFVPKSVYILCEGTAKLSVSSAEGKLLIVRIAGPGDVLGLAAAIRGSKQQATVETLEVCELKAIDRAEFLSFLQAFNEVGHNSAETLAVEYESAVLSARRLALAGSAASKLASTLLEWGRLRSHDAGKPIQFRMPLTHEELGNMAGLSRETVTRLLGKFRKEGLLDQDGPQMTLREPGRMKQLYC